MPTGIASGHATEEGIAEAHRCHEQLIAEETDAADVDHEHRDDPREQM